MSGNGEYPYKPLAEKHLWEIVPVRDFFLIAALFFLAWGIFSLRDVLMPAFTGFLLAYIVEPLVGRAGARGRIPRSVIVAVLVALGLAAAALAAVWILPLVINQGYNLLKNVPGYLNSIFQMLAAKFGIEGEKVFTKIQPDPMMLLRVIGGIIGAASSALFWIFLLPFFFFTFSWKFPEIARSVRETVPPVRRDTILRIMERIDREWGNFFRARLSVGICSGFLLAFGWLLTGVPYWFLLGMLGGFLGIVPYLSVMAWVFALVFKYLGSGGGLPLPGDIIWPSVVFWAVHFVEEKILVPWIRSQSVNLSPATAVVVILLGGAIGGIGGFLFAIPLAGAVKIIFQELYPGFPMR